MSVTTAIPTIKGVTNMSEATINRLYKNAGIPQPKKVAVRTLPSIWSLVPQSSTISLSEVRSNLSYSDIVKHMSESSSDVIVEEVQLTPYITVQYKYNRITNNKGV